MTYRRGSGYLQILRYRGVPVYAHWSILLGLFFFSGGFDLGAWIGFFIIILGHEAGHAILARRFGLYVYSIEMHGLGGSCVYDGKATPFQRAVIAWGGVLAQGVLYVVAFLLLHLRVAQSELGWRLVSMLTGTNLLIAALNLLPLPFLDGGRAWKLFPMLLKRGWPRPRRPRKKPSPRNRPRPPGRGEVVSLREHQQRRDKQREADDRRDKQ